MIYEWLWTSKSLGFLCTFMYVYICGCMYVYICVYLVCVYMCACVCINIYVCMGICIDVFRLQDQTLAALHSVLMLLYDIRNDTYMNWRIHRAKMYLSVYTEQICISMYWVCVYIYICLCIHMSECRCLTRMHKHILIMYVHVLQHVHI